MNRKEIKELAKSKVKGNKWNIWWPMLVISFISSLIDKLFGPKININVNSLEELTNYHISASESFGLSISVIITGVLMAGYTMYLLCYVRNGKFDSNTITETIKAKWVNILIATILTSILIGLASMLFVIPGIVLAMAYAMVMFLIVDSDVSGADALKKSREMMKGYKCDYFVFLLSFIGWFMLVPFTFGIILIWLIPYFNVARTIYYDKLKSVK